MTLTIYDRITLHSLLPDKAQTYEQAIIVRDLRKKLILSQDELLKYNVRTELRDGKPLLMWNNDESSIKNIEFTELELGILTKTFETITEFPTSDEFLRLYELMKVK